MTAPRTTQTKQPITTLALRGICKTYTLQAIFDILDAACEDERKYDFVHLPKSGGQKHGGLAIVNFLDEESCGKGLQKLLAMSDDGTVSGIKSIGQSYIQGFAENLAYFTVLSRQSAGEEPMIFEHGELVRDIWPVIQKHVTPELITWAQEQVKALYGAAAGPQQEREELKRQGGRVPTCAELEQIRRLIPGTSADRAANFLMFSL
eukprot:s1501_g13.t1